ncbi:MAG: hypothetical protein EHM42_03405 [Planctomycetaceae bacterium]|nr:MAG: hypothetical protein EHM42_03405 [Planctomycetaceae bacterium]
MRKLLAFLFSVALGGALVAGAYEYHVLRTPEKVVFIRKQAPDWRDAYVDVRGWKARDWAAHPRLVRNVTLAKRTDVMESSASVPLPPSWFKSISNRVEEEIDEELESDPAESVSPDLGLDDADQTSERPPADSRRR